MLNRMIAFSCALAFLPAPATAQGPIEKSVTLTEKSGALTEKSAALREKSAALKEKSVSLTPAAPGVPVDAAGLTVSDDHQPPLQPRKDSLWNGVIIGAGLGALVGTLVSFAVSDCSECSGFNVPLTFGVLGAGAGAGIGAGIDAWHQKRTVPAGTRRLTVAPVLGKDVQAIVATIRF
jgi:hypothetical protein